jgi:hypothetical protein
MTPIFRDRSHFICGQDWGEIDEDLVALRLNSKPTAVWRRGLSYAQKYDTEIIILVLIKQQKQLLAAQVVVDALLARAGQAGIAFNSHIVVENDDWNLLAYKNEVGALKLIF